MVPRVLGREAVRCFLIEQLMKLSINWWNFDLLLSFSCLDCQLCGNPSNGTLFSKLLDNVLLDFICYVRNNGFVWRQDGR